MRRLCHAFWVKNQVQESQTCQRVNKMSQLAGRLDLPVGEQVDVESPTDNDAILMGLDRLEWLFREQGLGSVKETPNEATQTPAALPSDSVTQGRATQQAHLQAPFPSINAS